MRTVASVLVLCAVSWAQSNDRYVSEMEGLIKAGGIAAAHDRIELGVSDDPAWARRICAAAAESPLDAGLLAKDNLKDAAERIRQIGARCVENNPESADAWSAEADGIYFRVRVLRACGEKTATQDWLDVADALAKQHALTPDDPAAMERALKYLREGLRAKGVEADKLRARESEVSKEGVRLFPKSTVFLRIAQGAELDDVVALLAANGQKEAKPRLAALIANAVDDTSYNDAVTVAKQHFKKLGIKADYRTRPGRYLENIDYDVPKGERWEIEKDTIRQYGRDGGFLRKFSLDLFKRNINYTLGDTEYDGSNAKGMAMISERDVLSVIVKTERKSGIIKKALNRQIPGAQYFVVGGFDKDADFIRFHTYLWKSDQRAWLTYRVWIIEYQDFEGLDAEAQFVLDSFRETKYEGSSR